ncbi:MAG TPA: hypothetical protein VHV80_14310 [Steroidobacteraceae bacterium]|jgi:predicted proteasome-type protease|nr:hypothetical protein [Steroidobacteraceae bacterium]
MSRFPWSLQRPGPKAGIEIQSGDIIDMTYNGYFHNLRSLWSEALREAFARLPEPDWLRNEWPGAR